MAIDEPKGWISALGGLFFIVLGGLPLLQGLNIISFGLPGFMTTLLGKVLPFILAAGALWLAVDSLMEDDTLRVISLIVGILILAAGILTVLNQFGIIAFGLTFLTATVFNVLFVVLGFFLLIAAFAMW